MEVGQPAAPAPATAIAAAQAALVKGRIGYTECLGIPACAPASPVITKILTVWRSIRRGWW